MTKGAEVSKALFERRQLLKHHRSAVHRLLIRLAVVPGSIGRSAMRKSNRRDQRILEAANAAKLDALLADIGEGDIVLDLGANVGNLTDRFARSGATVHAFEPDPANFRILERRFAGTANVVLHEAAVGAEKGTFFLYRGDHVDPEKGSQVSSLLVSFEDVDTPSGVDVEVRAFDDVLASLPKPPRLIKMDIEGAELAILEKLRTQGPPFGFGRMLVETHEHMMPDAIPQFDSLRAWTRGVGDALDLDWH